MHKIEQLGGVLGGVLGPLLKTRLPLTKNVLKQLAKNVLIPLGLTAAVSATDAAIQQKIYVSGTTTLKTLNEETNDITKIVKSLESGLLIKQVSETIKNDAKEEKGGRLSILLGKLGGSLLGSLLTGKTTIRSGKGTIRPGQNF